MPQEELTSKQGDAPEADAGNVSKPPQPVPPSDPTPRDAAFDRRRTYADSFCDSFTEAFLSTSTDVDLTHVELDAKLGKCRCAIGKTLVTGAAGASHERDGIRNQTLAARTVGTSDDPANGGPLVLPDVDRLLALIRANNRRSDGAGPRANGIP